MEFFLAVSHFCASDASILHGLIFLQSCADLDLNARPQQPLETDEDPSYLNVERTNEQQGVEQTLKMSRKKKGSHKV